MNNWIALTVFYAICVACFESAKKKAVEKNSVYEVLAGFSIIAFFIVSLMSKDAFRINYYYLPIIIIKALIIVVAWILSVKALEKMPISLYSMVKISTIIFSVLLSYLFLGEQITITTLIGMSIVISGLVLVNKDTNEEKDKEKALKPILMLLLSCFLSSVSAIIDKKVLLYATSSQLQFWFLLFLTIFYWIILIIKKGKINLKQIRENYWIPIAAICLAIGDRTLFKANENIESKVIIITMLKRISVIVSILIGKVLFKEKDIIKKLLYSMLIIFGIAVMLVF